MVYINGPRQAGKSTLVRKLLIDDYKARYVTFDDSMERSAAIRNPLNYLEESGTPLIIDEVQMAREIFRPLKKVVDDLRYEALNKKSKPNGKYLLTGSANLITIPELASAMVGRMSTMTLLPFRVGEVLGHDSQFIKRCFSKDFTNIKPTRQSLIEAMGVASFPELMNIPKSMHDNWFREYVKKITFDDPRNIYNMEKAEFMPPLLTALAARAGNLVNDADLGRDIGINPTTVKNYRKLLNDTFITYQLRPWYRNINKRLVKASKVYLYDTKLLCHLINAQLEDLPKSQPSIFGHVLENFVLSELVKENHILGDKVNISFYRTNDGKEVDFILEAAGKIVAIEVKHAENITNNDVVGIRELQQTLGKDFVCGIILCNTKQVIPFDKNIYLVPINALWG